MPWEILLLEPVESWFLKLCESDPDSAALIEKAIDRLPDREAIFLVAGDKAGKWSRWYDEAIPLTKSRYVEYRAKKAEKAEEDRR
ncbi:hypothetical protein [Planobispora takensis]|uniref:hypothetical protein n=1 Tax=Planobispora takensis TaxID=1367882 RepID=UPI001941FCF1|nr:hypothetical protein [Planobispora takensis]